jgi:hypothetical protein
MLAKDNVTHMLSRGDLSPESMALLDCLDPQGVLWIA